MLSDEFEHAEHCKYAHRAGASIPARVHIKFFASRFELTENYSTFLQRKTARKCGSQISPAPAAPAKRAASRRQLGLALLHQGQHPELQYQEVIDHFSLKNTRGGAMSRQGFGDLYRKYDDEKVKRSLEPADDEPPKKRQYAKGDDHEKIMMAASAELAANWKKYGSSTRTHGRVAVLKKYMELHAGWSCHPDTLKKRATTNPGVDMRKKKNQGKRALSDEQELDICRFVIDADAEMVSPTTPMLVGAMDEFIEKNPELREKFKNGTPSVAFVRDRLGARQSSLIGRTPEGELSDNRTDWSTHANITEAFRCKAELLNTTAISKVNPNFDEDTPKSAKAPCVLANRDVEAEHIAKVTEDAEGERAGSE